MPEADEFRRYIESQAGIIYIGPDKDSIEYTFDSNTNYKINYYAFSIGGFNSTEELYREMQMAMMNRMFMVLGNPVRLQRAFGPMGLPVEPVGDIPTGPILIWRDKHTPKFDVHNSVWSGQTSYVVLPPYAKLVNKETFKPGA